MIAHGSFASVVLPFLPFSVVASQPLAAIAHPVYSPGPHERSITTDQVGTYMAMPEAELRALVKDSNGEECLEARDAAYHLACVYQSTGDEQYARKAIVLLDAFAEAVPKWRYGEWYGDYVNNPGLWGGTQWGGSVWQADVAQSRRLVADGSPPDLIPRRTEPERSE